MSRNNSKSKKNKGDKQVKKVKAGTYTFARGKICFIGKGIAVGSEQAGDRPAIIVSSDEQNRSSREVEVVFLTTKKKNLMPTHVPVDSAPDPSIALCEQIQTVDKWRIKEYLGTATWEEMEKIDQALAISLGLPGAKNGQLSDGVKPGEFRRGAGPPYHRRKYWDEETCRHRQQQCWESFLNNRGGRATQPAGR